MELNPYALCPCLSGEKLKFCCPRELHADLGRLVQLVLEGKAVMARDALQRLRQRFPRQHCLIVIELMLDFHEGNEDGVRRNCELLRQVKPDHCAVDQADLYFAVLESDEKKAIRSLSRLNAHIADIYENNSGQHLFLVMSRYPKFCKLCDELNQHLPIFVATSITCPACYLTGEQERDANEFVHWSLPYAHSHDIPMAVRDYHRARVIQLLTRSGHGHLASLVVRGVLAEAFEAARALQQQEPDQAEWLYVAGILAGATFETTFAAECLRRYAQHPAADESWAISSLLVSEYLCPRPVGTPVRNYVVCLTNTDALMEQLLSDLRFTSKPIEDWDIEFGPPPKGSFLILDRPRPVALGVDAPADEWPRVIGTMSVFGKETDQPARAHIQVIGEATEQFVREFLQAHVDGSWNLQAEGRLNAMNDGWIRPRVPPADIDPNVYIKKLAEVLKKDVLRTWLYTPHPLLDGLTPSEAKAANARVALLAALLHLETSPPILSLCIKLDELWNELGLSRDASVEAACRTQEPAREDLLAVSVFGWLRQDYRQLPASYLVELGSILARISFPGFASYCRAVLDRAKEEPIQPYHDALLGYITEWCIWEPVNSAVINLLQEAISRLTEAHPNTVSISMIYLCQLLLGYDNQKFSELVDEYVKRFRNDEKAMFRLISLLYNHGLLRSRRELQAAKQAGEIVQEPLVLCTPDEAVGSSAQPQGKLWVPGD